MGDELLDGFRECEGCLCGNGWLLSGLKGIKMERIEWIEIRWNKARIRIIII